jgi:hypothetical protein
MMGAAENIDLHAYGALVTMSTQSRLIAARMAQATPGLGCMYLLLLLFGAVLSAAGLILAATGVSLREGTFDATILMPGIVATIGGLLLIGLGVGLRTLRRIEQALVARSMPPAVAVPKPKPVHVEDDPGDNPQIVFPPKPNRDALSALADDTGAQSSEPAAVAEKMPAPAQAIAIPSAKEATTRTAAPIATGGNGAVRRPSLRFLSALWAGQSEQQKALDFDALWPKNPRPMRVTGSVATLLTRAAELEDAEQLNTEAPRAVAEESAATAEILKSGVVNGMPYTLYSDGSIEARLAEGTLRFGSITELRNHIEQSAGSPR